jgi:hypothetical protein
MTRRLAALATAGAVVVALGATGWAALAPFPADSRAVTYVIPPGTAARLKSGELAGVLPPSIHLTVGIRDLLVLTNDDAVVHQLGPVILGPRQTYRIPFRRPGRFQYACTLHAAGTLTLVIEPEPTVGLARLRYRLDRLVARS